MAPFASMAAKPDPLHRSARWRCVAANLFGLSCDFDHKPDRRSSLPMGGASGPIGPTESGSETKMTAHLPSFAIALMVLSMGSLCYGLYSKSQQIGRASCRERG